MMGSQFPIDTAQIVALFMESVAYGIFLVTFFWCMRVLLFVPENRFHLKPPSKRNWIMVLAALSLFVFATLDVAFGLRHNIEAFVLYNGGSGVDGAEEVFNNLGSWINVMKMVDYVAQTFIGDAILIWRCFLVWDRRYSIVIVPVFLWLGGTVCGCIAAAIEAASTTTGTLNSKNIRPFITTMLSTTLATNILTTSLIIHRLWSTKSRSRRYFHESQGLVNLGHGPSSSSKARARQMLRLGLDQDTDPLARAIIVVLESGFIYTVTMGILFVIYMSSNNAQLGVSDTVVQIIGITFNFIIIRSSQRPSNYPSDSVHNNSISRSLPLNHVISIHTSTITETQVSPVPQSPSAATITRDVHSQYRSSRPRSSKSTSHSNSNSLHLRALDDGGGGGAGGGGGSDPAHPFTRAQLGDALDEQLGIGRRRKDTKEVEEGYDSDDLSEYDQKSPHGESKSDFDLGVAL